MPKACRRTWTACSWCSRHSGNKLPTRTENSRSILAQADARMRRLMTVPGVGPVTPARLVAAVDDVNRFPDAASVAPYLGLIPGENTPGFRTQRTHLTRAGSPQVRWALGQAAWSL